MMLWSLQSEVANIDIEYIYIYMILSFIYSFLFNHAIHA